MDSTFKEMWGFLILATLLGLVIFVTPLFLIGGAAYIAYRLWRDSPARKERLARDETMVLYNHAQSGQVQLSDDEIDEALAAELPSRTPAALREQLLDVGWNLFSNEGLTPDIPPPPALCNTIEGARYRGVVRDL
jgi:hypothetical protein